MKNRQLFIASFRNFTELKEARKTPFWKAIIYLFLLCLVMTIPVAKQMFDLLGAFQKDCVKIAEKIPDFQIKDGKLATDDPDAKGFIYQTDTIVFTFDPEGKRSTKEITSDLVGNLISIGFTKDELVFSTADSEITTAVFGTNVFKVPYTSESLASLDSKELKQMLTESHLPIWGDFLLFFLMAYPMLFNLITILLMATLCSMIYTKMRRLNITFFESMKVMIYSMTLPVFLTSVIALFAPTLDITFIVVIASMLIFFQGTKTIEQKEF